MTKFPKEFMLQVLEEEVGEIISNKIIEQGRWDILHQLIWKHPDGRVFQCGYRQGATEQQDQGPWEYDKEVHCVEMEKKIVEVEQWVIKMPEIKNE